MNIKITTADTVNKLISAIVAVLPPIFNKTAGSNVVNTITAFCQAFKINVDQVNQMFNNTFLDCSSGTILDDLIKSYSGLKRKDDESDADYLNRHYKMVYTYNNSNSKVTQIVYDITSENPILIRAGSNRSAFWGVANSGYVESASGIAYYYDDIGEYTNFWGDINNSDAFKAYIYLNEKPSGAVLDELCNVLNYVRAAGTTIYLVYPPFNLIEPTATSGVALGLGEFTANYSSVDYATSYYLTIATNPAFSPIEQSNVVSLSNNYTFQGLSNSANYYYKVQAVSGIFQSDFSNSVQVAMRQLSTPTTTASSGLTSGFIANWNIVSGAVNYSLDLSLTSGFASLIVSNATTTDSFYTFSGLVPNNYFYRVKAVNGVHESQYAISSGTASSGSVVVTDDFSDRDWGVWNGASSMVGSGGSITSQEGNSISSSFQGSASWSASAKFSQGIEFSNSVSAFIQRSFNSAFNSSGTNFKYIYAMVCEFTALSLDTNYVSNYSYELGGKQTYYTFFRVTSSGISLRIQLVDGTPSSGDDTLEIRSDLLGGSNILNTTDTFGLSWVIDLENEEFRFIIHNLTTNTTYSTSSYSIRILAGFYSTIADFKAAGGVNSSTSNNKSGYDTSVSDPAPYILYREVIKTNFAESAEAWKDDVLEDFVNMSD